MIMRYGLSPTAETLHFTALNRLGAGEASRNAEGEGVTCLWLVGMEEWGTISTILPFPTNQR